MFRAVHQLSNVFSRIFAVGSSLSMIVLFLIVFINSVRRYTIGKSVEWGEELPVFIAIYGVMFGAAWAYMQDRHIRFTMLVGFLPERMNNVLNAFVDLFMAIIGGLLAYSGWLFVIRRGGLESSGIINLAKDLKSLTGLDGMIWLGHLYPYQAAMVVGGVLLSVAALLKCILRIEEIRKGTLAGGRE